MTCRTRRSWIGQAIWAGSCLRWMTISSRRARVVSASGSRLRGWPTQPAACFDRAVRRRPRTDRGRIRSAGLDKPGRIPAALKLDDVRPGTLPGVWSGDVHILLPLIGADRHGRIRHRPRGPAAVPVAAGVGDRRRLLCRIHPSADPLDHAAGDRRRHRGRRSSPARPTSRTRSARPSHTASSPPGLIVIIAAAPLPRRRTCRRRSRTASSSRS